MTHTQTHNMCSIFIDKILVQKRRRGWTSKCPTAGMRMYLLGPDETWLKGLGKANINTSEGDREVEVRHSPSRRRSHHVDAKSRRARKVKMASG